MDGFNNEVMDASKLKFYSIGVIAANKELNSVMVEVSPIEKLPYTDGELTDNADVINAKGQNSEGVAYDSQTFVAGTVSAKWLPINSSNRRTPPDVRRGETVILYQFANEPLLYWATLMDDAHLRKLETVVWAFSATRDESKPTDKDTSYYLEFSTHTKTITLHTCIADGEPFSYTVQINAKEGRVIITDDIDNYFLLDSKERQIRIENTDGSFMEVNKKDVNINAPENYNLTVGKNATIKVGENATINIGKSRETEIGDDDTTIMSGVSTTGASQIVLDAPIVAVVGNLFTRPGRGGSTGAGRLVGDFILEGSMTAEQDLIALQTVKANKIISVTNIEAPNV